MYCNLSIGDIYGNEIFWNIGVLIVLKCIFLYLQSVIVFSPITWNIFVLKIKPKLSKVAFYWFWLISLNRVYYLQTHKGIWMLCTWKYLWYHLLKSPLLFWITQHLCESFYIVHHIWKFCVLQVCVCLPVCVIFYVIFYTNMSPLF